MATKVVLVTVAIWSLLSAQCLQAGCGIYFKKQAVVYAVPVVAVATPVYQVGTDLEIKAAVEKALRQREAYAAQQALQKQQQGLREYQQQEWNQERQPQQAPPQQQYPTNHPAQAYQDTRQLAPTVHAKCAQCHANGNSSAGASYDISQGLSGDQFLRITDMIANKTDVPARMKGVLEGIKPDEYGKLLDEFIKLAKAGRQAPQVVNNSQQYGY